MIHYHLNQKLLLVIKIFVIYFFISAKIFAMDDKNIKDITEGNTNAKVEILIYESLTCPHCATFHKEIYPDLKKNFIDKGLVKIQFKSFPLDIAALNASKIAHCKNDGKPDILHFLYNNQNKWMEGENIDQINSNLKAIIKKKYLEIDFSKCINDKKIEDYILEERIESVKKFEINSTPTLIINNKKFSKPLTYKNIKKEIEKLI